MVAGQSSNFKSNPEILIIGAGSLGSRHLQGLGKIKNKFNITVLDPNNSALSKSKLRYKEIAKSNPYHTVNFVNSLDLIRNSADLAIIATTADIRFKVIKSLLKQCFTKFLILEKVVFQTINDFKVILNLLDKKGIKAWVNCPRRVMPFFIQLKERTCKSSRVEILVKGSNWGLACNAIHFIDLLSFLSGQLKVDINESMLEKKIFKSKRKGFIELGGTLTATTNRGDFLKLIDQRNDNLNFKTIISFDNIVIEIDQQNGLVKEYLKGESENYNQEEYSLPLQSDLTGCQVIEILNNNDPGLTSLHESSGFHIPLIQGINQHLSTIMQKEIKICPIT